MRPSVRRDQIVELLLRHQRLTVEELAQRLGASQETIRRDLNELGAQNRLRKFHGGAALPDSLGEGAFRLRMVENLEAKRAIARRAAALFAPGEALFIDTGSTTIALAGELAQHSGLTVITNAASIAHLVSRSGANPTFLLGGEHRHESGQNLGPMALRQIEGFAPAHAVLTVGGLTADGAMDFDLQEAEIARAMIARARQVTLLADASKLGRPALFRLCGLEAVSRLVTDLPPPAVLATALAAAGVEVLLVDKPEDLTE
ncbi:DeoR/GlpR family DNA-binding transcription regulator [Roseomonas sp. E05]|uniref:DeoR/GlpR family DNA-binding transcription regulator n=1 Tax=Roseomonas sp. E05 TaxID=3046310 RepID=UPI0024BB5C00|nr:DeoR/GlpR family DNA-binding transcription regulator [Roseomonas sp. E05]MDJ0391552.1 DeoR/GlpR family DNA-binding transcription regulator [Roseomonas sp. E05]